MAKNDTFQAPNGRLRRQMGTGLTILGLLIFILGAAPEWYGMQASEQVGIARITIFLLGLAVLCLGGYLSLDAFWHKRQKSIAAEIGVRLAATGFVIALASGFADIFGLGTRPFPNTPFFGYWQARGVLIGQVVIVVGFLLMIPWRSDANKKTED